MNRLPLRLESSNVFLYGTVDPAKMWKDYDDEEFQPVLVGGKAVVNIWFNNFTDTDCGGAYLETWYNTFVTRKSEPQVSLELAPPLGPVAAAVHPTQQSFLMRVLCSDAPGNP